MAVTAPLRHVPPVHSPIDARAALRALVTRTPPSPVRQLERLLAERFDADEVILCGSGTQALQLALAAARADTGRDLAALPAYTCYDIVSAAVGAAVRPAFYDLDADTLTPESRSLQSALATRPAAVIVVHHFGIPTPVAPLEAAAPPGIWVIEDAAQAHGGSLDGRPLGSLAPLSVLSFGRGKGWTGGEGGALLLRGAAVRSLDPSRIRNTLAPAAAGPGSPLKLAAQWLLARPALYALPSALPWLGLGETRYHAPAPPRAISASAVRLLLASGDAAEREADTRRSRAARLRSLLTGIDWLWVAPERGRPGALRLPLRIRGRVADSLLDARARRLGLMPGYPRPLPTLDATHGVRVDTGEAAMGAAILARELFTAPTHSLLSERDLDALGSVVRQTAADAGPPDTEDVPK